MNAAQTPSVAERARRIDTGGAPVVGLHYLRDDAVFVLGEEALLVATPGREPARVAVHAGGILASACDGERVLTGGDDGTVAATGRDMKPTVVATDAKRRWVDHLAPGPDGAVAWSAGKDVFVETRKGEQRHREAASTVGGLAFAPKGLRLAIAHYNGVTMWFPNAVQATPEFLEWKGSHIGVTYSPDGRFIVTAMQETALHGWRLTDGNNMRMSGYQTKVRAMSWLFDGKALATSGANQLVLWPFHGKDGPMGKKPMAYAPAEHQIATVAAHPRQAIVAAGYANGLVMLVRAGDGAEILARRPAGSPVSALAWSPTGAALAFGTEDGDAGILDLA